jgi:hypothetical protein
VASEGERIGMSASRRGWLGVAVVTIGLAWSATGRTAEREPLFPEMSEDEDEAAVFVLGNTLFTFYREISRAMLAEFALPPADEAAIDGMATMLMLPNDPDALRDEMVVAAASGVAIAADRVAQDLEVPDYWKKSGFDDDRTAAMVCLITGSDPVGFHDFAEESGLDDARVNACREDFDQSADAWLAQLDPFTRETRGRRARGGSIKVVYDDVAEFRPLRDLIRNSGVVEAGAADLVFSFVMPRTLGVRFARCGAADAWWKPTERTVTICYELVQSFDRIIREDIQHR